MNCPRCGTKIDDANTQICPTCQTYLVYSNTPQTAVPPPGTKPTTPQSPEGAIVNPPQSIPQIPQLIPTKKKFPIKIVVLAALVLITALVISLLSPKFLKQINLSELVNKIPASVTSPLSEKTNSNNELVVTPSPSFSPSPGLQNNYKRLVAFSKEQEGKMGVFQMVDSGRLIENYKGVPIFDTGSRRFKPGEVDLVKRILDKAPAKTLETPPKAVVSICCDDLKQFSFVPTTYVAFASGPYILINDSLFEGGVWSGKNSENEKTYIFFHEYTHTTQYYYLHQKYLEDPSGVETGNLDDRSTLAFDYIKKVGWGDDVSIMAEPTRLVFGDEIDFFKNLHSWELPENEETKGMANYEKSDPAEDQATAFGYFIAGQGQLLSPKRQSYVSQFLGESLEKMTMGVVPQIPISERGSFDEEDFTKPQIDEVKKTGVKEVDRSQWFAQKGEVFENVLSYYKNELSKRNFKIITDFTKVNQKRNENYVYGLFEYGNRKYLISILDFLNATGYSVKPDRVIVTLYIFQ